jgi:hypothetical protein
MTYVKRVLLAGMFLWATVALLPTHTAAQTLYGNLVGTVTDTSGAVLPGATVTARNVRVRASCRRRSPTRWIVPHAQPAAGQL